MHDEGLLHTGQWAQPKVSDSVALGWDLRFCIFNKLSADVEAAGWRTTGLKYRDLSLLVLILGHSFSASENCKFALL